jgi:hypothetical protein
LIVAITKVSTEVLQVNAMSAKDVEMDKSWIKHSICVL